MARRTVLTSNFNRRAISFFGTPSTRCRWRTSTHWDILITSASSWLGRRDDRVSPPRSSQAIAVSECSGGPCTFLNDFARVNLAESGRPPGATEGSLLRHTPCRPSERPIHQMQVADEPKPGVERQLGLGRRDDRVSPPRSSQAIAVSECSGGPCTFLNDFARVNLAESGRPPGATEGSLCLEHLKRTCAPAFSQRWMPRGEFAPSSASTGTGRHRWRAREMRQIGGSMWSWPGLWVSTGDRRRTKRA